MNSLSNVNPALLAPLVGVSLLLLLVCLVDLYRTEHVQGGNKWAWLAIIVLLGTVGQIAYLLVGRSGY